MTFILVKIVDYSLNLIKIAYNKLLIWLLKIKRKFIKATMAIILR